MSTHAERNFTSHLTLLLAMLANPDRLQPNRKERRFHKALERKAAKQAFRAKQVAKVLQR